MSVVDIAGLVKGANEGQGLGNAFLSHISGCDAIFHMTRAFDDSEVMFAIITLHCSMLGRKIWALTSIMFLISFVSIQAVG